jgi:hypothetical protein
VSSRSEGRRQAGEWLGRNYPMPPGDFRYDPDLALDETGLRAFGYQAEDVMAWQMDGREAAELYARATRQRWGREQEWYVNPAGQVIAVTDVRGDPHYPEEG